MDGGNAGQLGVGGTVEGDGLAVKQKLTMSPLW